VPCVEKQPEGLGGREDWVLLSLRT